ncbi:MAG: hypothetical protein GY756_03940, partial [bacterium]|nr:hypothetical protein [bacterium]
MYKIFFSLLFIACSIITNSQDIYIETGKIRSSFNYKNSEGNSLDNILGSTNNYIGVGYRFPILATRINISAAASYNEYGAEGSDRI